MGVLSCSRPCCDNIMCDTYIENIGYMCDECIAEFKPIVENKTVTESDIKVLLEAFMRSEKGTYSQKETTVEGFFNSRKRE